MSIFQNTCKPKGFCGSLMINSMNLGHKGLHNWGFKHLEVNSDAVCLDIGCGGGTNLKRLLGLTNNSVCGIDYSEVSVRRSSKRCKREIANNRCQVELMNVLSLRFPDNSFDVATAFETIYFWGDLVKAFSNIYGALKKNGRFLICNETNGRDKSQEKWCKIIEGMKIYSIDEIKEALMKSGFSKIEVDDSHRKWLSIIAIK